MAGSPREAFQSREWPGLKPTPSNTALREGLVFVFDLDGTIATGYTENIMRQDFRLNPEIVALLRELVSKRGKTANDIAGIFMYTNNSDIKYITFIHMYLSRTLGVASVFDDILSARDPRRQTPGNSNNKPKTLVEVAALCDEHGISTENLSQRVFFFDDQTHPDLLAHLGTHYIYIRSRSPLANNNNNNRRNNAVRNIDGYVPELNSATNMRPVRAELDRLAAASTGGRRRNRTRKHKRRYTRKHYH